MPRTALASRREPLRRRKSPPRGYREGSSRRGGGKCGPCTGRRLRCVPGVEELGGQHKAEMNRSGPCQASPAVGKHTWIMR